MSFPKTTWSFEKCCMRVENSLQALRPASEAFAQEATEALRAGKVIAVPTDTLYGLACDAWYDIPVIVVCVIAFLILWVFVLFVAEFEVTTCSVILLPVMKVL